MKRGILDAKFVDGIYLSLKLPGIQWTKQFGVPAMGASFGIILTNEMELEISMYSKTDYYPYFLLIMYYLRHTL